jgi:hypothetical protein
VHESKIVTASKLLPDTFVYKIAHPEKTVFHEMEPYYLQDYDNYIKNLKKSCEISGAEFKIPKYARPMPIVEMSSTAKPQFIRHVDDVIVKLNVLKCGKVRVKLITHMATLHEKYFSHAKKPPVKILSAALKAIGYDEQYITKMPGALIKQKQNMEIRWKNLEDGLFNKPSASSTKKKIKKKEPEPEPEADADIEPGDEDEEDEEDGGYNGPDDEALDIDNEDEDEEVVEEEYFSDAE